MFRLEFTLERKLEVTHLGYILFAESFNVIYSNKNKIKIKTPKKYQESTRPKVQELLP